MDPHVVALFAFCASALGDALVVGAARGVFARAAEALPDGGRALRRLKGLAGDEKSRFCNGIEKELLEIAGKAFSDFEGIRVDRRALRRAKRQIEHIIKRAKPEDYAALAEARTPEAIEQVLRRLPRKWGRGIREADRQWFDELVGAVAREYTILAPWSPTFQVRALDAILDKLEAIHDVTTDNGRKLDELLARPALVAADGAGAGRVVFGARPDVAAGFVEREEQETLRGLVVDERRERVVLVGMAGCGKSQLASSLAQECGAAGWGLVAWINASSKDSVISDLVELARRLGVDTSDNPTQDQVIERCLGHLQSADAGDRLVVFDNVKRIEDVAGVVPRGEGLRVVATSRSGRGWRAQRWKTVAVGVFPREESVAYLLDAAGSQDAEAADAVARRLGDLPLAVAQAAATASDEEWTLKRYLERLEKYSSRQVIRPVPGDSYTRDVSSALRMAVDSALDRIDDGLREVARLQVGALAVLAESGVPTRWIDPLMKEDTGAAESNEDMGADAGGEDADARDDAAENAHLALTALAKASVVQQSADGGVTMLHRLQGQVLRENWNLEEWAEAFDAAADLLDRVNIDSLRREDAEGRRREARDLIDQFRAVAAQGYSHPLFERGRVVAGLPHVLFHAEDLGLPNEALALRGAVSAVEEVLGEGHPDTLASRNNLAVAYESAGRLGEAIPLFEEVLADRVRVLGDDHPDTLTSRGNLAAAYYSAGRVGEAIALFEEVLADRVRVLGEDHPDTLVSRNNLAYAYESAGRLGEAITLYEQVLADRVRVLGADHPDTLVSRNNLAGAYESAGRLGEAIPLYEGVLADTRRVLGADHPDTLAFRNNLAYAYESAGRLGEAIPLFEGVFADRRRVLGADHPDTLTSRNNLAGAYRAAGRHHEAITLFKDTLEVCEEVLSPGHPLTTRVRKSLETLERETNQPPAPSPEASEE